MTKLYVDVEVMPNTMTMAMTIIMTIIIIFGIIESHCAIITMTGTATLDVKNVEL